MKYKLFLILLSLSISLLYSQNLEDNKLSPRNANYNIKVKLDPINKTISAEEILNWTNITKTPVKDLQFHLYLNAFKNSESTFMKESRMRHRGFSSDREDSLSWGWIDINSIVIEEDDILSSAKFVHPDDSNFMDQTVLMIPLKREIKPGESINVKINFNAKLPKIMARTGYSDDYFLVGQWFPKIGVWEDAGQRGRKAAGWNCHQFHANSEFYADFGNYDVNITVPQKFIVGATGVNVNELINTNGTKTLQFIANDVLDFAWTASPNFVVVKDKWKNLEIKVLLQPQHLSQAARHTESVKNALEYFEKHLGPFPYPSLTIVDPPFRGLASAGMEYPMFITAGCLWGIPDGLKYTEMVTIHEFGHNYFMGILASNEFEEAWLDEGFNSWYENKIMDKYYGEKSSMVNLFGFRIGDTESSRLDYTQRKNPFAGKVNQFSWTYKNGGYGTNSYSKPSIVLQTLENILGSETMDEVMKIYYDKWKFKHPGTNHFINIVKEVVNNKKIPASKIDVDKFFDQLINSNDICDYKVTSIASYSVPAKTGIYDDEKIKTFVNEKKEKEFETKTIITRLGEVKLPIEIKIVFDDGTEILENWNGESRNKTFKYFGNKKIETVHIDPKNKILVEMSFYNNSLTVKNSSSVAWKYAAKVLFWVQNSMLSLF